MLLLRVVFQRVVKLIGVIGDIRVLEVITVSYYSGYLNLNFAHSFIQTLLLVAFEFGNHSFKIVGEIC